MLESASRHTVSVLAAKPGTDIPRARVRNLRVGTILRVYTEGNLTYLIEIVSTEAPVAHIVLATLSDADEDFDGGVALNCALHDDTIETGSPIHFESAQTPQVLNVTQLDVTNN